MYDAGSTQLFERISCVYGDVDFDAAIAVSIAWQSLASISIALRFDDRRVAIGCREIGARTTKSAASQTGDAAR